MFVVTPEWIFKSARTWERASEADFLADEWKAKQEKLMTAAQEAAAVTTEAADAPPTVALAAAAPEVPHVEETPQSPAGSDHSEPSPVDDAEKVPAIRDEVVSAEPTASSGDGAAEATATATKAKKKSVSFAASVAGGDRDDDSSAKATEGESAGETVSPPTTSGLRQRRAPVRRVIGGARVGGVRIPEHKGVVASGGTFDFLSKITQIGAAKRESKLVEAPKPTVVTMKAIAPEPAAAKVP